MLASNSKVISCHFLFLLVLLHHYLRLYFLMFGVLLKLLLVDMNIMLVLSMLIAVFMALSPQTQI
jgi:hypothetical protein